MTRPYRDPALDTLLDLHDQTMFIDGGYWVKFIIRQTGVTPERPHGLSYSLTLHAPNGDRLVGFDNAHPVEERHGPSMRRRRENDHRHRVPLIQPYEYQDAATLMKDFWEEVDAVLEEKGLMP